MGKLSLISRHIVLFTCTRPTYGIILIEDEIITDIISLDISTPVLTVIENYSEWNPIDLEEFYISPGIIDFNVRKDSEDYSHLTQQAVSGGVTFILCENNSNYPIEDQSELYCDVGEITVLDPNKPIKEYLESGCLALKGYLYAPNDKIQPISSKLENLFEELSCLNIPLIIDPAQPHSRQLFLASPFHNSSVHDRLTDNLPDNKLNPAAFPDDIVKEQLKAFDSPKETRKNFGSPQMNSEKQNKYQSTPEDSRPSIVEAEFLTPFTMIDGEDDDVFPRKTRPRAQTYTIFDDLNKRIKENEESTENISLAEQSAYSEAGSTVFSPMLTDTRRRSSSFDIVFDSTSSLTATPTSSPPKPSMFLDRVKSRRPTPLVMIKEEKVPIDTEYVQYLATIPDSWEISGVETIINSLKQFSYPIHLSNLSSASSVNLIRQARLEKLPITCETCVHYLFFTKDSVKSGDTRFKDFPPIKSHSNFNLLWDLLKFKTIDAVTSHHLAIDPKLKFLNTGSFKRAVSGVNTIGYTLQALWTVLNIPATLGSEIEHYICRLGKWLSLQPSQILKLKNRGSIEKGKFADFVIWKPYEKFLISNSFSSHPEMCIFLNQELKGKIHQVYIRGSLAYSQDEFIPIGKKISRLCP